MICKGRCKHPKHYGTCNKFVRLADRGLGGCRCWMPKKKAIKK